MNYIKIIKQAEENEIEPIGRHSFSIGNRANRIFGMFLLGAMSAGFLYGGFVALNNNDKFTGNLNIFVGLFSGVLLLSCFFPGKIILDFDNNSFLMKTPVVRQKVEIKLTEIDGLYVDQSGILLKTNRKEKIRLNLTVTGVSKLLALLKNYLPKEAVNMKRF